MPGCEKSAPKAARPVTFSTPSGRMVRLPIHLLSVEPFAVMPVLPFRLRVRSLAQPFPRAAILLARLMPAFLARRGSLVLASARRARARGAHAPNEPGPILKGSAPRATVEGAARV